MRAGVRAGVKRLAALAVALFVGFTAEKAWSNVNAMQMQIDAGMARY